MWLEKCGIPAYTELQETEEPYLCWTISAEISCIIEYSADVNDEADIFRMAQSVQFPE